MKQRMCKRVVNWCPFMALSELQSFIYFTDSAGVNGVVWSVAAVDT